MPRLNRTTQRLDRIYVTPSGGVFVVAADGEGRIWFDTTEEAREEFGRLPMTRLEQEPEDF